MPRTGQPRTIAAESNLARRVRAERERRGWTLDTVARRMTTVGCPLSPSALSKIERQDPPRRITANELAAFSQVFQVRADDLLLAPELAEDERLGDLLRETLVAMERAKEAMREYRRRRRQVGAHLQQTNPGPERFAAAAAAVGAESLTDHSWPVSERTETASWSALADDGTGRADDLDEDEIDDFFR